MSSSRSIKNMLSKTSQRKPNLSLIKLMKNFNYLSTTTSSSLLALFSMIYLPNRVTGATTTEIYSFTNFNNTSQQISNYILEIFKVGYLDPDYSVFLDDIVKTCNASTLASINNIPDEYKIISSDCFTSGNISGPALRFFKSALNETQENFENCLSDLLDQQCSLPTWFWLAILALILLALLCANQKAIFKCLKIRDCDDSRNNQLLCIDLDRISSPYRLVNSELNYERLRREEMARIHRSYLSHEHPLNARLPAIEEMHEEQANENIHEHQEGQLNQVEMEDQHPYVELQDNNDIEEGVPDRQRNRIRSIALLPINRRFSSPLFGSINSPLSQPGAGNLSASSQSPGSQPGWPSPPLRSIQQAFK